MKYIKQFAVLVFICLIGELVVKFLPFAFPGNIMAMVLLAVLLVSKVIKEEVVKDTCEFLVEVIGLFIVPISVGVIAYFELIRAVWLQLLLISLITLVLTFASCAFTIRVTMKVMGRKKKGGA